MAAGGSMRGIGGDLPTVFDEASESRKALALSEASLALLRATTDAMLDPQVVLEVVRDPDGRLVDLVFRHVNRAACLFLRERAEDLVGRSAIAMFPNVRGSGMMGRIAECLEGVKPVIVEDLGYLSDVSGEYRRFDVRAARTGIDLIVATWRDVTERLQNLDRIAASEERYRLLVENSGDVVIHTRECADGGDEIVWVSPNVAEVLGAPVEHWLGRRMLELVPPEDAKAHAARWKKISEGAVIKERVRFTSADGVEHWFHMRIKPFYDAEEHRDGAVTSIRPGDQEVAAEQALEEARREQARADERYRRAMDNAAIGMCLIAPDGRFVEVNAALCELFGYDAETLKQRTWQELTAPEYLAADLQNVDDVLEGRIDSYRMLKQYIHANGDPIWGDLTVSCIRDEAGQVENFISQITDMTTQVEATERNRLLAEQLRRQGDLISAELESAAAYMLSIMPIGLTGKVAAASRYLPSRGLGGDCFDYTWIDDDHLLVYLIDVSGHGIEPALLSVSVHNMIRSGSLTNEILRDPGRVLTELNRLFQMEQQNEHYFTMWCGVYEASTRTLRYACGGAPPALAFDSVTGEAPAMTELSSKSLPVGMFEHTEYASATYSVPPGCRMLLYSDGAYELEPADGRRFALEDFKNLVTRLAISPNGSIDELVEELRALTPTGGFEDDCSLIGLRFT